MEIYILSIYSSKSPMKFLPEPTEKNDEQV